MKVLSLFSGIGAFEKALDRLGVEYELVNYCEIDKYASKSYAAIHNVSEDKNLGDITKINEKELPKDIDLITYGFPCQDISLAGKQKGLFNEDGTQTRSGLFFEALRIIEETQPRVAIAENVKNLVGKKFKSQFEIVLDSLDKAGYNNYWQVLNAKDYGIPQNRERVFIVSIRKDIDNGCFKFPEPFELKLRLKDILEDEVDEKFFLSDEAIKGRMHTSFNQYKLERNLVNDKDIHPTILARFEGAPTLLKVDNLTIQRIDIPQTVVVRKYPVDCKALCECLRNHKGVSGFSNKQIASILDVPITKVEHWFRQDDCFAIPDPDIWIRLKTLLNIKTDEFDEAIMTFEEKEGVYEKSERHYCADGIAPTLTSTTAGKEKIIISDKVINPLKDKTQYGWHFEQNVYDAEGITRALKAGGGSGNIPKVIVEGGVENE